MIDQDTRDSLRNRIQGGDYKVASIIYRQKTGRRIGHRYLYMFLRGERNVTGRKENGHNPLAMYSAMVDAVKKREMEAEDLTMAARGLLRGLAA